MQFNDAGLRLSQPASLDLEGPILRVHSWSKAPRPWLNGSRPAARHASSWQSSVRFP